MCSRLLPQTVATLLLSSVLGCRAVSTPQSVAREYAAALQEGHLSTAYGLLDVESQSAEPLTAYEARFSDPSARAARAAEVDAAVPMLNAGSGALQLSLREGSWRVAEVRAGNGPRSTLKRFLESVDHQDFDQGYLLLAGSLRARYTPARLRSDFALAPGAPDRLARARAALGGAPQFREGLVAFPIGDGREVVLQREGAEYRILALE